MTQQIEPDILEREREEQEHEVAQRAAQLNAQGYH